MSVKAKEARNCTGRRGPRWWISVSCGFALAFVLLRSVARSVSVSHQPHKKVDSPDD